MKVLFQFDTETITEQEIDVAIRSIISLYTDDWKEWISEMYYEFEDSDLIRCPECEEKIFSIDPFCRWCGTENKENKS